jgi:hypothetical protein
VSEHTPGPWVAQYWERDGEWWVIDSHTHAAIKNSPIGDGLACLYGYSDDPGAVVMANARLIAAAPDLLAVCEVLLEETADKSELAYEFYARVQAAVAKAKGETA